MGQLHDQEKWAQHLPPGVMSALVTWLAEREFSLHHRGWFDDGRSGEPVAKVVREKDGGGADQRILKFFKAGGATRVSNIRQASRDANSLHKPHGFGKHIAEVEDKVIPLGEWSAVFLYIAHGNLEKSRQLGSLIDEVEFPAYCAAVVRSVLTDWNGKHVRRETRKVADIITLITGRRHDDALAWARHHGILDRRPRIALKGWARELPNPFRFLTGPEGQEAVQDLFVGKAHGDLNGRNVIIPTDPINADSYVLIDCDRYSDRAPLTRDPMYLLVALALDNFDVRKTQARNKIANVLVDPGSPEGMEPFRTISAAVHGARPPRVDEGWGSEWDRQCLLSLVGVGLTYLGRNPRTDAPDETKEWCLYTAALAAERYLERPAKQIVVAAGSTPAPAVPTTPLVDRRGERTKLWTSLTSESGGIVTLNGTRGIGKTALVNSVLKELSDETGYWAPSQVRAYEVTAAAPLDVQTLVDCVVGEPETVRPSPHRRRGSPLVRLEAELRRLGRSRVVVSIDSAENLLDPETGQVDRDLDEALEVLATEREHRVTVLLVTQCDLFSPKDRAWSTRPPEIVPSMSDKHYSAYLAGLDRHGRMDPESLPEDSRRVLHRKLAGNPRLAELAHAAIVASNGELDLAGLTESMNAQHRDDVPAFLTRLLISRLSPPQLHVLEALASFGTPVPETAVKKLVDDVSPTEFSPTVIHQALSMLAAGLIVHRTASCDYFVPPDDCELILRDKPEDARSSLYFLAAAQLTDLQNLDPRGPADLRVHFAELTALLNSREHDAAYNMIELIDGILREWNCGHLLRKQREEVSERLRDRHLTMANWNALGDIYTSEGRFTKAGRAFKRALKIAGDQSDDVSRMRIQGNLAAMYWEKNDTRKALDTYELASTEAHRLHDPMVRMGALAGMADCHRRRGDYRTAISHAETALSIPLLTDYPDTPHAVNFATSQTVTTALKLARWFSELGRPDDAKRLLDAAQDAATERPDDWLHASCLDGRADVLFDRDDLPAAESAAAAAEEEALRLRDPVTLLQVRTTLCLIHLSRAEAAKARLVIERAQHHRRTGRSLVVLALHALTDWQKHDHAAAKARFKQLREEASQRIRYDERDFAAHDFKGVAICGLHLAGRAGLGDAVEAFRTARSLTPPTPALVNRMRLILGVLDDSVPRSNRLEAAIAALAAP
ncbi:tetratricopeptide repeat protein [Amycolatopsis sp. NPDC051371]|uniref:tetratricopeptide repeat protein n=1 Tax=Amycolatopsis sp. NPDC051371 TaxID=3155800 RepID=UPI00341AB8A6